MRTNSDGQLEFEFDELVPKTRKIETGQDTGFDFMNLFIFIIIWLSVAPIRIATEDIMNPDTVVAQEIMAFNRNSKRGITKSGIFIKYSPKPVRNPNICVSPKIFFFVSLKG